MKYVANMSKILNEKATITFRNYIDLMAWFRTLNANNFNRYTYEWTNRNVITIIENEK